MYKQSHPFLLFLLSKIRVYYFIIILAPVLTTSCIKEYEPPKWEVDALTPVFYSSLNIYDIINDTSVTSENDDTVSIVFQEKLAEITIDTLIQMDVKPFRRNVKLDSIHLNKQTVQNTIFLGEIIEDQGMTGLIPDGSTLFFDISSFNVDLAPDTVDASEYFHVITLEKGMLLVTIINELPAEIQNIDYSITNLNNGDTIHSGTFPQIPAHSMVMDSADLSGKVVEGKMLVHFGQITVGEIPAGTQIDYSDSLSIKAEIKDMKIHSAEAVFPAQTIINHKNVVFLEGMVDTTRDDTIKLVEADIREGLLRIQVISTIDQESYFTYRIPGATRFGVPFEKNMTVPPAPPGSSIEQIFTYDFDNYHFDLTGKTGQDTVNAFYNELIGEIDSIGRHVFLSLEDSVKVVVEMLEIKPSYAGGYLGQQDFMIGPDSTSFDVFHYFNIDSLGLKGTRIDLVVENGIGMEGRLQINTITAINSKSGGIQQLDLSSVPNPFAVESATDHPLQPTTTTFGLDDNNSNISELISLLPDKFYYDFGVLTNPEGPTGNLDNFARSEKGLNTFLKAVIPLNIKASNLTLSDTIGFNKGNIEKPEDIRDGELKFIIDNGFPLDVSLVFHFMDEDGSVFDTLSTTSYVAAASVDSELRVIESRKSTLSYFIPEKRMASLLAAKQIIVKAYFNTIPRGKHLQIFDDYFINIKCVGDFIYAIEN